MDIHHSNIFAKFKNQWEQADYDPAFILLVAAYAHEHDITMPDWAANALRDAAAKTYNSNGDMSIEQGLGITKGVKKKRMETAKKEVVADISQEVIEAGLSFDETRELTNLEIEYVFGFEPYESQVIDQYRQKHHTGRNGLAYLLVHSFGMTPPYDPDVFVHLLSSGESRRKLCRVRLEAYRNAIAENIPEKKILKHVNEVSVRKLNELKK